MERENRKAIILGLDGATFDVLLPRVERGQMPNLAALLDEGVWGELQSTTPPFSAQAWASMVTGKNPARHGIVDFWARSPGMLPNERRNFVTADLIQGETLWQTAGRQGRKVGVVNVPVTYPPSPVNGYLVSGLLTPQGKDDFTYPPTLRDKILAQTPDYLPDPFDPLGTSERQILELEGWMAKHEQVSRRLLENDPVDLFFGVVQMLDHLQHLFWNDIVSEDGRGGYTPLIDRCYEFADGIVGHRRQRVDGRTNLFLVSDHGFGPAKKWFHVNRFLLERGLLVLDVAQGGRLPSVAARLGLTPQRLRDLIRRLDVLGLRRRIGRLARVGLGRSLDNALSLPIAWSQTMAISGSPATEGIFVNLAGRQPQGIVEPGPAYEALRERLMAELLDLRDPDTGQPAVQAVYRREELYEGPYFDLLPDVVLDFGDNPYLASDALPTSLSGQRNAGESALFEPLPHDFLQGRHRAQGIFAAAGPDIRPNRGQPLENVRIIDVAPTVLYALGLPIPKDMDGRPLVEIFCEEFRTAHPAQYAEPERVEGAGAAVDPDQDELAEMERRLRGLGYVS